MTDETTTEQLAGIDRDMADIERQVAELVEEAQRADYKTQELPEYTPPEGWRVVQFGEELLPGDVWVNEDGTEQRSHILQWDASAVSGGRCIRRIKPQPQANPDPKPEPQQYTPPEGWRVLHVGEELRQGDVRVDDSGACSAVLVTVNGVVPHGRRYIRPIEPQPEPVQVREGRWWTRNGEIKNIRPCEPLRGAYYVWPWTDGFMTYQDNGRHLAAESDNDLVEYLGPIEPEPQQVNDWPSVRDLRHELKTVQTLLGESRQRVTQLEELVASLRTINRGCENAVREAGNMNTALRNQLAAVKAELANVAADRQRLQIELDAAQQVPPDSPELRQLRADLAEVTRERDEYRYAHDVLVNDVNATHQRTKAMTVEAIAEWLEPIRAVDNEHLANETLQHLPQIMRHLTGLNDEEIE